MTQSKHNETKVLQRFIAVYCRHHHESKGDSLCPDCADLQAYALGRLAKCPLDPKPKCKKCPIHCYKPEYQQKIREVMKFSGIHFVKRGRVDWLVKYFLS